MFLKHWVVSFFLIMTVYTKTPTTPNIFTMSSASRGRFIDLEREEMYYSFVAAILQFNKEMHKFDFNCGGSILNDKTVISAAHCLDDKNPKNYKIRYGHEDYNNAPYESNVTAVLPHKKYSEINLSYDIGLLHLKSKVVWHNLLAMPYVSIVNHIPDLDTSIIKKAYAVGWESTTPKLKEKTLKVHHPIICKKMFIEDFKLTWFPSFICVGNNEKNKFINKTKILNQRDSGSALVSSRGHVQVGVASHLPDLGRHLAVYINVTYYVKWINAHAKWR